MVVTVVIGCRRDTWQGSGY